MDITKRLQAELDRPDGSTGSGREIRALITDALADIERMERFGVRMLVVHEGHTREMAEKLIKVVDSPET